MAQMHKEKKNSLYPYKEQGRSNVAFLPPLEAKAGKQGRSAMDTERNPLWRKGNRNIFCPFYRECLDDAIKGSWEDWDCDECKHKLNYENRPWVFLTVRDSIEY